MEVLTIWFWQKYVNPHTIYLADALAKQGHQVVYAVTTEKSNVSSFLAKGLPVLSDATLKIGSTKSSILELASQAPAHTIHIFYGIRASHPLSAVRALLKRRLIQFWVMTEKIRECGPKGRLRWYFYWILFYRNRSKCAGVLAIGFDTLNWLSSYDISRDKIFPFAYFLNSNISPKRLNANSDSCTRVIYVGQLVPRKGLDLLLSALKKINQTNIELVVVGTGTQERTLRAQSEQLLPGRVKWIGAATIDEVPSHIEAADCLVLPSRYDGWGAVVTEALMVGTPVVCSDACGSAEVVLASKVGGVFPSGDADSLAVLLERQLRKGKLGNSERARIANWARSLGADSGAAYLLAILRSHIDGKAMPIPPWIAARLT